MPKKTGFGLAPNFSFLPEALKNQVFENCVRYGGMKDDSLLQKLETTRYGFLGVMAGGDLIGFVVFSDRRLPRKGLACEIAIIWSKKTPRSKEFRDRYKASIGDFLVSELVVRGKNVFFSESFTSDERRHVDKLRKEKFWKESMLGSSRQGPSILRVSRIGFQQAHALKNRSRLMS